AHERVVAGLQHLAHRQLQAGSMSPLMQAEADVHLRLVDGEEVANTIREALANQRRVVGEPARAVRVLPAAAVKELERVVPMEQGDPRFDARSEQLVDQAAVEVESLVVDGADARGNDAGPAEAEAIGAQAE